MRPTIVPWRQIDALVTPHDDDDARGAEDDHLHAEQASERHNCETFSTSGSACQGLKTLTGWYGRKGFRQRFLVMIGAEGAHMTNKTMVYMVYTL